LFGLGLVCGLTWLKCAALPWQAFFARSLTCLNERAARKDDAVSIAPTETVRSRTTDCRGNTMNAMRATSLPTTTSPDAGTADGFTALDACHRKTLSMLDELSTLVTEVERGELDHACMARAAKIASFFSSTPPEHHADEERHVFPALVAGGNPQIVQTVLRLQQDHDWLEEDWFELGPHVQAIAAGQLSYDVDFLREGVEVLAALYRDHIELEESLIYPEARAHMPDRQRREMGREMAARHRARRASRRSR